MRVPGFRPESAGVHDVRRIGGLTGHQSALPSTCAAPTGRPDPLGVSPGGGASATLAAHHGGMNTSPSARVLRGLLIAPVLLVAACQGTTGEAAGSAGQQAQSGPQGEGTPLVEAIDKLTVAGEHASGYEREAFNHWIDADDDCLDTRDEVLAAESSVEATGGDCDIATGEWFSYYDERTWTSDDDLDIDHTVALGEAWRSGAWAWSDQQREAYANDLDDERTLVAVTASVNRSKSDKDPAEWLPESSVCRYVSEWVAVKIRWQLSIDPAEHEALVDVAAECQTAVVAPVKVAGTSAAPDVDTTAAGKQTGSTSQKGEQGESQATNQSDGEYLFPESPDLDCSEIDERGFKVRPGDPHGFDSDGNGIGCED